MIAPATFHNRTTLAPGTLGILFVALEAILVLPRRYAAWPLIAVMCFVPYSQRVVVLGLDLSIHRLCFAFVWVRLLARAEWQSFRWQRLDVAVIAYGAVSMLGYCILTGSTAGTIRAAGVLFDTVGTYFVGRHLIRSWEDADSLVKCFVICLVPVSAAMVYERIAVDNPFSYIFSEIPAAPRIREGIPRSRGAFPHPILAGLFCGLLMPLILTAGLAARAAATSHISRRYVVLGMVSMATIAFVCASSTPILTMAAGALALMGYGVRKHVLPIAAFCALAIAAVHFGGRQPVWSVLSDMAVVEGSTAHFRFRLIDAAVERFGDWWVVGTVSTLSWGHGLDDITNQFVMEGISGGIFRLGAFCLVIAVAFSSLGRSLRYPRDGSVHPARYWGLWVMLFMAVVSFNGVSYFGQNVELYYLCLALIGSLCAREPSRRYAASIECSAFSIPVGGPRVRLKS